MFNKLLIILGPTATGKTDLALRFAKKFNGELIACDSRQVYKYLDLGTGKFPGQHIQIKKHQDYWIIDGIKIWMYDQVDPMVQYDIAQYIKDAGKVLYQIRKKNKLPIIVGGTGFYLRALLYGLSNLNIPINSKLRGELAENTIGELQQKIKRLSPTAWEKLNNSEKHNKQRLIRKIELLTMYPYKKDKNSFSEISPNLDCLKIGLKAPRPYLNQQIDLRVLSRISLGLVDEAKKLIEQRKLSVNRMKQLGLEYKALADFLLGKIKDEQDLIKFLQTKIHQYAKRQLTYFKKEPAVLWFDISQKDWQDKVEKQVFDWYNS